MAMYEQHRFMRGLSVWVGFRQDAVQYERHERFAGETRYPSQVLATSLLYNWPRRFGFIL